MSAEVLRRAVAQIRNDRGGAISRHTEDGRRWLAVADWLEDAAENLDMQAPGGDLAKNWDMRVHISGDKALAVARAYIGEQP